MARSKDENRDESSDDSGWNATTVLVLVGMIALAIAVGLLFD